MNIDMTPEEIQAAVGVLTANLDALLAQTKALPDECAASVGSIAVVA